MINNYITYLSGGMSGMAEIFFIHPIEYYKTVKQANQNKLSLHSFIMNTTKNHGVTGLYKGFFPRFVGIIPMRTVFWGTLTTTENILKQKNINSQYIPTLSGIIAGFAQTIVDCPVESLKTKIMTNNTIKNNLNFHGFTPNLFRNVFFAMIFNVQKNKIESNFKSSLGLNVVTGSISGITASVVTQPLDYLKTQKQIYGDKKSIRQIIYETKSIKEYWRGGGSRAIITCLSMSVGLPIFNFINYNIFQNNK